MSFDISLLYSWIDVLDLNQPFNWRAKIWEPFKMRLIWGLQYWPLLLLPHPKKLELELVWPSWPRTQNTNRQELWMVLHTTYNKHIGYSFKVYNVCAAILDSYGCQIYPNLARFPFWAEDKLGPYISACIMQIECCQLELTHPTPCTKPRHMLAYYHLNFTVLDNPCNFMTDPYCEL